MTAASKNCIISESKNYVLNVIFLHDFTEFHTILVYMSASAPKFRVLMCYASPARSHVEVNTYVLDLTASAYYFVLLH
jgi:hypothetical protein